MSSEMVRSIEMKWKYYAAPEIPDGLFDHGEVLEDTLNLPDGRSVDGIVFDFPESGIVDMNQLIQPNPAVLARTVLKADFSVEEECSINFGLGADWMLVLRLNGEILLDTRRCGNSEAVVHPLNFALELNCRKGKNQLIYEVFGGKRSFHVAAKVLDVPKLKVEYGPWSHFPDAEQGRIVVTFKTSRETPAGICYRKKGSQGDWITAYDNLGGQIRRDTEVHNVMLFDLSPDTEYEYRIVVIDEYGSRKEKVFPEIHSFRTAPEKGKSFQFMTFADLQLSKEERSDWLKRTLQSPEGRASDFFALLGDVNWAVDFDQDCIEEMVLPYLEYSRPEQQLWWIRGNHEIYGKDSNRFFRYFNFPSPGREGYGMSRWGDVCFIVLDFCDDGPRQNSPATTRYLHDFEPYIQAQKRWLAQAVKLDVCRDAKYRIVLAHGLPVGDNQSYMPEHARQVIDPVFGGKDPVCRIHLWLGGHVHYAVRTFPGENVWRCSDDLTKRFPERMPLPKVGVNYDFPVCVHSGPSAKNAADMNTTSAVITVDDSGIHVVHRNCDGAPFDRFTVQPDGSVVEEWSAEWFRRYEY